MYSNNVGPIIIVIHFNPLPLFVLDGLSKRLQLHQWKDAVSDSKKNQMVVQSTIAVCMVMRVFCWINEQDNCPLKVHVQLSFSFSSSFVSICYKIIVNKGLMRSLMGSFTPVSYTGISSTKCCMEIS